MMKLLLIRNWQLLSNNKTVILIAVAMLYHCYFFAQNLVPNSSFESYSICPSFPGEIYYAYPWFQPTDFYSADYYVDSCVWEPIDQNANNGKALAGIILYYDSANSYREYIEVQLISPLSENKKYCVEFYVSLSYYSRFGIDNIHALFTIDSVLGIITDSFPYEPQIKNEEGFITDSTNWSLISEEFIAIGGEQFLTIGNFHKNDSTNWIVVNDSFPSHAYYYIDDVSVTLCDTTTVEEFQDSGFNLQIFPNPNNGNMYLKYHIDNTDKAVINIYDVNGKLLLKQMLMPEKNLLEISDFNNGNGVYYYSIKINDERTINKKLVIIR